MKLVIGVQTAIFAARSIVNDPYGVLNSVKIKSPMPPYFCLVLSQLLLAFRSISFFKEIVHFSFRVQLGFDDFACWLDHRDQLSVV